MANSENRFVTIKRISTGRQPTRDGQNLEQSQDNDRRQLALVPFLGAGEDKKGVVLVAAVTKTVYHRQGPKARYIVLKSTGAAPSFYMTEQDAMSFKLLSTTNCTVDLWIFQ